MRTLIIGGTVAGLTLARLLAERGEDVVVVPVAPLPGPTALGLPVATAVRGTWAHEAALRHGRDVATDAVRRLVEGIELVAATAAGAGVAHERVRAHGCAVDGHLAFELRHEARALRWAGAEVTFTDEQPFAERLRPIMGIDGGVRVDLPAYAVALVAGARAAGARIHEVAAVTRVSARRAVVAGRTLTADRVVDTVGVVPAPGVTTAYVPVLRSPALPSAGGTFSFVDSAVSTVDADPHVTTLYGRPTAAAGLAGETAALVAWCRDRLRLTTQGPRTLAVEVSGDGLPVVGELRPGVWAARGLGLGELGAGTAAALELARALCDGVPLVAPPSRGAGTLARSWRRRVGELRDPVVGVRETLRRRGLDVS